MNGRLVIFSAPSGAGKTTIVQHLLERGLNLEFSVSATSRAPRNGEKNGIDYFFMSAEEFRRKIKKGDFIEWEEVYHNHYYGTLKSEIERIRGNGNHVIFDVDVVGGLNLKSIFGRDAISVFIMPPSIKELESRLRSRATDNEEKIIMRINKANSEIGMAGEFDHVIINDDLDRAINEAELLVKEFTNRKTDR